MREVAVPGWCCRLGGGFTNRANSANPIAPGARLDAVLPLARTLYPENALPVLIRVTPLAAPDTDARLDGLGFSRFDASIVMTAAPAPGGRDPGIAIAAAPTSSWLAGYARAAGASDRATAAQAMLLGALRHPAAFAMLVEGGQPFGFGIAVSARGETGLFNIATDPAARGRGVGQRITAALLGWGAARGDARAYLQVLADNEPALALYRRAGFRAAYRYHYRVSR